MLTFGTDGTANLGSDVVPWDDFLTYRTEAPFYSEYPAEVLSAFNAGNMIDTTICCSWPDHAARVLDAIEAEWPDPAARQAAPAIVQFLRDAVSQNGNASYAYLVDDAVLRIGRIEKAHGCEIPQRALEGILSNLDKNEFASLRLQVLVSFVAYAEAEFVKPATTQSTCIIQ